MNVGRNAATIDRIQGGDETFAGRAVFFRLAASAPQHFHSMRDAAFRTDAFDRKTIRINVLSRVDTLLLFLYTIAISDNRHIDIFH